VAVCTLVSAGFLFIWRCLVRLYSVGFAVDFCAAVKLRDAVVSRVIATSVMGARHETACVQYRGGSRSKDWGHMVSAAGRGQGAKPL